MRPASASSWVSWVVGTASLLSTPLAHAVDASAPLAEASAIAQPPDPRTEQVRALLAGKLEPSVSPQSLFDVSLHDKQGIRIEAARVRAVLRAEEERKAAVPAETSGARSTLVTSGGPEATARDEVSQELEMVDPVLWANRLNLDRARLDFYELDADQRQALLSAHAARREAASPAETESERRAREVAEERARALEAGRLARSEAERVLSNELIRLNELEMQVHAIRQDFQLARDEIALRRDAVLGWQRRVRDARSGEAGDADAIYDALRRTLRASRDDLAEALDALSSDTSGYRHWVGMFLLIFLRRSARMPCVKAEWRLSV
jgi:hypothetical protein